MKSNAYDPMDVVRIAGKRDRPVEKLVRKKGKPYLDYRHLWDESNKGILVQPYPLHLDIEVSPGCNLRCLSCVRSLPQELRMFKDDKQQFLSLKTFQALLSEGVERGLRAITLNGNNEPLLKRDIAEYVRAADRIGLMDIMLHTNGNLLTRESTDRLLGAGLTAIYFSIDAFDPETYKRVRPGGDLSRVMDNIDYFLEQKTMRGLDLPVTRVSFVETRWNTHELKSFIEYWEDKVDFVVSQNFVSPFVGMANYHETEKRFRIPDRTYACPPICPYPFQRMLIRNNGDVTFCCSWYSYGTVLGNIYSNSVEAIWMGEAMQALRERVNGPRERWPEICKKCRKAMIGANCGQQKQAV